MSAGSAPAARAATTAMAAIEIRNRRMSMKPSTSHPLPLSLALKPAMSTLTPYHGRNSDIRRTMPPTPATMSPVVSLDVSMGATIFPAPVGFVSCEGPLPTS
jgi:hypothetical protein